MEIIVYIIGGAVAIFFVFSALSWGFMDAGRSVMSITVLILVSILVFNMDHSFSWKDYLMVAGGILFIFYNIRDMGIMAILALLYFNYQVLNMDHVASPVLDDQKHTEYSLPSTESKIIPTIKREPTSTLQEETTSANAKFQNKELFGQTEEVEENEEESLYSDDEYYLVNTAILNVRVKPKADSRKVTSLSRNEKVKIVKESGGWAYIENTGWVSKQFLKAL